MIRRHFKPGLKLCNAGGLAVLLILVGARPAPAQELELPRARQGYFIGGNIAALAISNWENGKALGTWSGSGFGLRMGEMLTPHLGLGLTLFSGGAKHQTESAYLGGLGLEGQANLWRNLSLRAGFGLGFVQLKDSRVVGEKSRGTAGAFYTLGVGYDWFPFHTRRSGGFALTPVAAFQIIPSGGTKSDTFSLGFEMTWWTGRPRDQLRLPESEAYR